MSQLARFGGEPITKNLLEKSDLKFRQDLERKYLLEAYDSGTWDDWSGLESMAARFEKEWADFNRSKFCALLTNGTHTLQLALETLDIGFGDEVVVPGLTWQATASAVCDVNAIPIIVDIDPETLCIDPPKIEQAITPNTRAIIPVHLYHRMADMDAVMQIAQKHNLYLIEDCAHTHGSIWNHKAAGTIGDFGSFSFQRSKLINSGEGGALLMQNEDDYWKVISQRSCGREMKEGIKVHSGNYRMTSFQAAILLGQLEAHRKNAAIIDRNGLALDKAIADAPGVKPLFRNHKITRQCSYAFVFLYDSESFDGLDVKIFRKALAAELGINFDTTYTPLDHSEVYYPHTKKRHQLSESYQKAINPSRWELPVANDVWANKAVLTQWNIFSCPPDRASLVTDAIVKIYENRSQLIG
ncbi:MAG: DegT/DnrJ/EryC1/StrS family aminotransferase [bacterium]|nr:MAG: DegT/DnrJ/EryC1/StrS family aminotransferase [bacterium]